MADSNPVAEVISDAVQNTAPAKDPKNLSLESLVLLITSERLHKLESDSRAYLKELKQRQQKVSFLHKIQKTINAATNSKGEFDLTPFEDLKKMFAEAKDLGVDLDTEKLLYNNEERERLVENLRMTVEDLNVQNEMQLQMLTRLTNERYESYQMARSILKPLHDDKLNKARAIAGR